MIPPIKLLIVTPSLHIGGAEKHVVDLSMNLKAMNISVDVLSSGGTLEGDLRRAHIRHVKVGINTKNWLMMLLTIFTLRKIIKQGNYDLLHIHAVIPTMLCWLASIGLDCRIIASIHGLRESNYKYAGKILSYVSDQVIAVSTGVYQDLIKGGIRKNKLFLVQNGIDTTRFSYTSNKSDHQTISIGIVGRLAPEKGHKFLIEAISMLKEQNIKCYVVGGGELEKNLKELVQVKNVADKVVFTGFLSDVQGILSELDIMVMPSLREGLPLALLESMAMGKAVIATKVGGIPDVITHNKTGLLVQAGRIDELVSSIDYLIANPKTRYSMGEEARKFILEQFHIRKMVAGIIDVYVKTLEKENPKDTFTSS